MSSEPPGYTYSCAFSCLGARLVVSITSVSPSQWPHEALDDATPHSVYRSALRAYPDVLPPLEYPDHFEVRKVSTNGIRWHARWINISSALGNEFIGLEPIGPALWQVYFGPTTLGWFDEELFVIFDTHGNTGRNPIC